MRKVLTFGTFDLFHPGHQFFLEESKKHGEYLIVVVSCDTNVLKIKGRRTIQSEQERLRRVAECSSVDEAFLGYEDWGKHQQVLFDVLPDVVCLGYDQHARLPEGTWEVVRVPAFHPEKYKSSLLRKQK